MDDFRGDENDAQGDACLDRWAGQFHESERCQGEGGYQSNLGLREKRDFVKKKKKPFIIGARTAL